MKKIEPKKDLFIIKRMIAALIKSLIISVLILAAVLSVILVIYSLSKHRSIINTALILYDSLFKDTESSKILGLYLLSLIIIEASPLMFILILNSQLKNMLGASIITVTKWYFFYTLIYYLIKTIVEKTGILTKLAAAIGAESIFKTVSGFVKEHQLIMLLLLIPPFLATLSSVKNRAKFTSIYEQYFKKKLELKNSKNAERERIKNNKITAKNHKVIMELQAKATAFNEKIEQKMRHVVIPKPDTDDMI